MYPTYLSIHLLAQRSRYTSLLVPQTHLAHSHPSCFPLLGTLFLADSLAFILFSESLGRQPVSYSLHFFHDTYLFTVCLPLPLLDPAQVWEENRQQLPGTLLKRTAVQGCVVNTEQLNYLCQNSREGHTVPQPRSFLATAKSSRFRGFRLVNSGATASFPTGSASGFTAGLALVENAATWHPKEQNPPHGS